MVELPGPGGGRAASLCGVAVAVKYFKLEGDKPRHVKRRLDGVRAELRAMGKTMDGGGDNDGGDDGEACSRWMMWASVSRMNSFIKNISKISLPQVMLLLVMLDFSNN